VSGFTTTGASILTEIEHLPKSVLLWRSTTHWIGGLGFVVFSLSLLPILGSGGMQLMKFEASRAVEEKIKPKVKEIARTTFAVYLVITVLEVILLKLSGLGFYEAINHTFATVATGGFSTRNTSVAAFNNPAAEMIIALFMFLGSVNLQLYYRAFKMRSIRYYFKYYEVKSHLIIIFLSVVFVTSVLFFSGTYSNLLQSLRYAVFQVATAATTTGFASTDYTNWPSSVLALLMILSLIGASSGSTAGGLKQFRFIVMLKTMYGELKKTAHPHLVYRINLGEKVLDISMINALWAYVSLYFGTTVLVGFILTISGYDLITSFSASIACITSLGPGLAKVGPAANFSFFHGWEKLLLSFEMILGRLELLTMLSIFLPSFWKE
jgi:trk system potassium uptake protein TrkH